MLQFSQFYCLRRVMPRTVPWMQWWFLFNDVSNLQAWLPHRPFSKSRPFVGEGTEGHFARNPGSIDFFLGNCDVVIVRVGSIVD